MMEMKIFKWILFLLYILNPFIFCQIVLNDEADLKALSCASIVTHKYKNKEDGPSAYSPLVLACFIKISEKQAYDFLSNLDIGINSLTKEEIEELIDVNILQDFSEEEINQKSKELENSIQEFYQKDQDFTKENKDYDNNYINDKNNIRLSSEIKNIIDLIIKGIKTIFIEVNCIWHVILILVILYNSLMIIRKLCDEKMEYNDENNIEINNINNKQEKGKKISVKKK